MYNSGAKYPSYREYSYSREFSLPENYSGSTFVQNASRKEVKENEHHEEEVTTYEAVPLSENILEDVLEDVPENVCESDAEPPKADDIPVLAEAQEAMKKPHEKNSLFDFGKLFGAKLGFEELLIVALIFLLGKDADNEDIIILLAILLFIN